MSADLQRHGARFDSESVARTHRNAIRRLLDERHPAGHWEGELSSSALSTATAALALGLYARTAPPDADACRALSERALAWLAENQNADGGWGDTTASPSNPSTTALAWTALGQNRDLATRFGACLARAEKRLVAQLGSVEPTRLARALLEAYGDDRTFSVPILVACALGGRLGSGRAAWQPIPSLPFELAALPHQLFQHLGLPMVSYAMPALIAIGQALHHHCPTRNPLTRLVRDRTRARTLRVLRRIQPGSGGFLEATPLTSFVVASLVGSGEAAHPVVEAGLRFLRESVRPDGSWPIDTNLATWLTSLSIDALAGGGRLGQLCAPEERNAVTRWLAGQQYSEEHPYTHAAPGGWAWTDLTGGVPDADDTSGALIALGHLHRAQKGTIAHGGVAAGLAWLFGLQNRDGGIPTFCRGWSGLPFDRSCADLSAHALRAFAMWGSELGASQRKRLSRVTTRARDYLIGAQREDGSWVPLWFGNQQHAKLENPLYGTTRVLKARATLGPAAASALRRGESWLLEAQNEDGGFGGAPGLASTIEETALAVEALVAGTPEAAPVRAAVERAAAWLAVRTDEGRRFDATPIGLYFAKLWYSEKLYPLIFTVSALERALLFLQPIAAPRNHETVNG